MESNKIISNTIKVKNGDKVALLISLCFMILTFLYLFPRYVVTTAVSPEINTFTNQISLGQTLPFIILALLIYLKPSVEKWTDKIFNYKIIYYIGYITMLLAIILTLLGHPMGLWWTWFSVGLLVAIVIISIILLKDKVSNTKAVIISIAIASIWRGLWELPYQFGMKLIYDAPQISQDVLTQILTYEVTAELPMIIGGIAILVWYKNLKLFTINKITILCFLAYIIATVYWFKTGFWVELHYDWASGYWIQSNHIDYLSMGIYKFSKVALALATISILIPKRRQGENT